MGHPVCPGNGGALAIGVLLIFQGRIQSLDVSLPLEGNSSPERCPLCCGVDGEGPLHGEEKQNKESLP